jgi:predicted DNA-binding antitoxin AbrB/MazE fold protein
MIKKKSIFAAFVIVLFSFNIAAACFTDTAGHPFEDAICGIKAMGVVEGYPDGSYGPDNTINRAEFTKIIISIKPELAMGVEPGLSTFPDVTDYDWFYPHVVVAREFGIISGYPDGTFKPANPINLAEGLKIILETFDAEVVETGGEWYEKYINAAVALGILEGIDVDPGALITRGEMAQMVFLLAYYSLGYDQEGCIGTECDSPEEDPLPEEDPEPVEEDPVDMPIGDMPAIPGMEGSSYSERICEGTSSVVSPCDNPYYGPCQSVNDYYAIDNYGDAWTYGRTCEWGKYNTTFDPCTDMDDACVYQGSTEVVDYEYGHWILENAIWTLRGYFSAP